MPKNIKFVALLALMSGLAPISIHILLPILPEIEKEFMRSSGITQLSLSLGLFAMAFSTIAYGPAADRFGRKPVLLTGLSIFVVGSLLCFWSPNIEILILGRVIQAAGGAAGTDNRKAKIPGTQWRASADSISVRRGQITRHLSRNKRFYCT